MGKQTKARIDRIFDDLRANGKLAPMPKRTYKRTVEPKREDVQPVCCEHKFKGNLPSLWIRCADCPLTQTP